MNCFMLHEVNISQQFYFSKHIIVCNFNCTLWNDLLLSNHLFFTFQIFFLLALRQRNEKQSVYQGQTVTVHKFQGRETQNQNNKRFIRNHLSSYFIKREICGYKDNNLTRKQVKPLNNSWFQKTPPIRGQSPTMSRSIGYIRRNNPGDLSQWFTTSSASKTQKKQFPTACAVNSEDVEILSNPSSHLFNTLQRL